MKILKILVLTLLAFTYGMADNKSIMFASSANFGFCAQETPGAPFLDALGAVCNDALSPSVRIRVFEPQNSPFKYGFALKRPFLVLDGIYLNTDGLRTLDGFEQEVNAYGLTRILSELGYTPVLVQFSETVTRSLRENGNEFNKLLQFMNGNTLFDFVDRQDGFVVMGISQGGILGRYGAYLYDLVRPKKTSAPIRLYASLDSPHQGAVLPLSLYYTINFWATRGGSAEAEAFRDLIEGPGASGLLLHDYRMLGKNRDYYENTSSDRFLFGEYRKAAEYRGFPSVLVAQGQLKGNVVKDPLDYFKMNRRAQKTSVVMGRVISEMRYSMDGNSRIAYNRVYKKWSYDYESLKETSAKYDFVQGSTYPFAETMYKSLKAGFDKAIPSKMSVDVGPVSVDLSTGWEKNELYQTKSTFIPTVSAMDMKCNGKLAIGEDCAFSQKSEGFPFTNPGNRSSAKAVYAVDPTHPRYDEPISGRHIELPEWGNEDIINGMRIDLWRLLCELANADYDSTQRSFNNEKLAGHFVPGTNCMDLTRVPVILGTFGNALAKNFGYSRYVYANDATEKNESVSFDIPAGWHKVSLHDNGTDIPEASVFEIGIKVNRLRGNWMKAELLLYKSRNGGGQLQMQEIDVPMDGETHLLRWNMPAVPGALDHYRWFALVLNSDGANVTLTKPNLFLSAGGHNVPTEKVLQQVYPGNAYKFYPWTETQSATEYSDALGSGMDLKFGRAGGGMHIAFDGEKSLEGYSVLKIRYWPGSCSGVGVYFDSYKKGLRNIGNGVLDGNFMSKEILLTDIVNTLYTPEGKKSASRLAFENSIAGEHCLIYDIVLK